MDRQLVLNEGERIIGDEDDFNARMHRAVYGWACEKAQVATWGVDRPGVLDFGCGSGYGTKMLMGALPENTRVFAEDCDPVAIEWARCHNQLRGYDTFRHTKRRGAPLAAEVIDVVNVVVALGVLEHLPLPPKYYVLEWLKAGVTVIGSVPYREYPGVNLFHYHSRLDTEDIVPYGERGGLDCEWRGFRNVENDGPQHVELGPDAEQYRHQIVLMMFCLSPKGAER